MAVFEEASLPLDTLHSWEVVVFTRGEDNTSVCLYGKAMEFSKVLPDGLTAFALSKLSSKKIQLTQ